MCDMTLLNSKQLCCIICSNFYLFWKRKRINVCIQDLVYNMKHTCFFRTKLFAFIYNVPWCLFPSMSFSLKFTFCFPQKWKTFFFQYINNKAVKPFVCVCVFWIKIVKYFKDFVLLWMFTIGQCLSTCRYCMPANVWFSVTLC